MSLDSINIIRKKQGISIEELSKKSGVPLGTLSKISAGITKDPKLETVKAIAKALNCTLDDFEDEENTNINENKRHSVDNVEYQLIQKYRSLDERGQETVDNILDIEYSRVNRKITPIVPTEKEKPYRVGRVVAFGGENEVIEYTKEESDAIDAAIRNIVKKRKERRQKEQEEQGKND